MSDQYCDRPVSVHDATARRLTEAKCFELRGWWVPPRWAMSAVRRSTGAREGIDWRRDDKGGGK